MVNYSFISIIIPVYNVEKFITRCLDSILNQTYVYYQVILVNDGSTDNSGKICDVYSLKDSRFKVFHRNNEGVSSARNYGISQVDYSLVTFVDSDDWLDSNYLESFNFNIGNVEMYMQGYKRCKKSEIIPVNISNKNIISSVKNILKKGEVNNILNSPVAKVFLTSIVRDNRIAYDRSISYGEDHIFVLKYLKCINKLYISSNCGYNYDINVENSLTKRIINPKLLLFYSDNVFMLENKLIKEKKITDLEYVNYINTRYIYNFVDALKYLFKIQPNRQLYLFVREYYNENLKNYNSYTHRLSIKLILFIVSIRLESLSYCILKLIFRLIKHK